MSLSRKVNSYQELLLTFVLPHDLELYQTYAFMSSIFFKAMTYDEELRLLHKKNTFKLYTFSSLYPLEDEKIYKKGRMYMVKVRSFDTRLIIKLKNILTTQECGIQVITSQIICQKYRPIKSITTVTPVICTVDNQCWTQEDNGLGILMERIHNNTVKKTQRLDDTFQPSKDLFFENIEVISNKPILMGYTNSSLLGTKLKLKIAEDPISQQLAFTIMGAGLLEKNSLGMGFCNAL